MSFDTGQSSGQFAAVAPSVAYVPNWDQEEGIYVMAFQSADNSNRLLIITSDDGNSWGPEIESGQSTQAGPSLVVTGNRLFAFFISNGNDRRSPLWRGPTKRYYSVVPRFRGNWPHCNGLCRALWRSDNVLRVRRQFSAHPWKAPWKTDQRVAERLAHEF